ncbi:MAG: FeS assembly SUF system protein [Candidatus Wildermuthbacteria bacterium GWA2_46_15]|uniref:FeS assembly SUF system protein n=1 Tax=Candidatus Wildermuthbacteria bacterium GWA2_46_15 TaxID=1802443 RepID=A0A1G2QN53_9BACT|nr:MAG: FeS assembly SUF system protein [Candidatus Wildermuthbacteria bacterium GWA2_46_15]
MAARKEVWRKLGEVMDPELNIPITDLGLIYDVKEKNGLVNIKMTLTSLGCPLFGLIEKEIKEKLLKTKEVKEVNIELVFDPAWNPGMMTPEAKARLGI